jgi:predicted small metal-binding protein
MGFKVVCKDIDPKSSCPYVASGDSIDELQADLAQHAKTVHNYTDEQLQDPKVVEAIKAAIKED